MENTIHAVRVRFDGTEELRTVCGCELPGPRDVRVGFWKSTLPPYAPQWCLADGPELPECLECLEIITRP